MPRRRACPGSLEASASPSSRPRPACSPTAPPTRRASVARSWPTSGKGGGTLSRIGKMPIDVPSGVEVKVEGTLATVTGPRGTLSQTIPTRISVRQEGSQILVERPDDERENRALHGLVRSLVANMVEGVTKGFEKQLEIRSEEHTSALQSHL